MWLYETSGILEVHIGPNTVPNPSVVYQENGSDGPVIGIYEFNSPSNCTYSYCLSGTPSAAASNNLTGNINIFGTSLTGTPAPNTVYIFDPNLSAVQETASARVSVFPNPANDQVSIQADQPIEDCFVYSLAGTLLFTRKINGNVLDVSDLPEGVYLLETHISGTASRSCFVISR